MQPLPTPVSHLPSIKRLPETPPEIISNAIDYLCDIYTPQIRGSRRRTSRSKDLDLRVLREDAFERAYSIRWLTALIAQGSNWESEDDGLLLQRQLLVERAAGLLAACSGTAGAGTITRNFTFPFANSCTDVSVSIRDLPLKNDDYTTLGAQTWGGACVLSEMITETPEDFVNGTAKIFRVLELGAGTGLVGLAFAQVAQRISPDRAFEVVLTDFNEPVLKNLESNILVNFPRDSEKNVRISSQRLDWSSFASSPSLEPPFNQTFDLVLGADIIYEEIHAQWILDCLDTLLAQDGCFHLVIPLRKTHRAESSTIESVFGARGGGRLVIVSKEMFVCDVEGELEKVDYAYYRIVRSNAVESSQQM